MQISILRRFVIVVFLAAVAAPAVALAVATPLSPRRGAVLSVFRPVFTWTMPSNERADAIYVANRPATTPAGRFYKQNVVDAALFTRDDVRRYVASHPLYAGRYWWIVQTSDLKTNEVSYSAPVDFRLRATTSLLAVLLSPRHSRSLVIDVRWSTNSQLLTVHEQILLGTKVLWRANESRQFPAIGGVRHTFFTWTRPRALKPGTLLRLRATVAGDGHVVTKTRFFRAP